MSAQALARELPTDARLQHWMRISPARAYIFF